MSMYILNDVQRVLGNLTAACTQRRGTESEQIRANTAKIRSICTCFHTMGYAAGSDF